MSSLFFDDNGMIKGLKVPETVHELRRWTPEEDDKLLKYHILKYPLKKQAYLLNRSVKSVEFRRRYYKLSWYNRKIPVNPQCNNEARYVHPKKNNKGKIISWYIVKKVNGKLRNFGSFKKKEQAINERIRLEKNNWKI